MSQDGLRTLDLRKSNATKARPSAQLVLVVVLNRVCLTNILIVWYPDTTGYRFSGTLERGITLQEEKYLKTVQCKVVGHAVGLVRY